MNVSTFICPVLNQELQTNILSREEIEASSKYKNSLDRLSRLQSHLLKRTIIGIFAGIDPSLLRFESLPKGKPYVVNAPLSFNITHTREYVAISIVPFDCIDIGVDIETISNLPDDESLQIASLILIPREMTTFLGHEKPTKYLLKCWTIKESIMKGCGLGFYCDPLCLSTNDDESSASNQVVDRWHVATVDVGVDHILSQSHRIEDLNNLDLKSEFRLLDKNFLLCCEKSIYSSLASKPLCFDSIEAIRLARPAAYNLNDLY